MLAWLGYSRQGKGGWQRRKKHNETGENDKLDAKHNAGVGPGNAANEANLVAIFSFFSPSFHPAFSSDSFPCLSLVPRRLLHFSFRFARCVIPTRVFAASLSCRCRRSRPRMSSSPCARHSSLFTILFVPFPSFYPSILPKVFFALSAICFIGSPTLFLSFQISCPFNARFRCIFAVLVSRIESEDVDELLRKGFDLAKRARGDALRALVTSRAEIPRGPWNHFPTIEIDLPPLSRCSPERKPAPFFKKEHGLLDATSGTLFDQAIIFYVCILYKYHRNVSKRIDRLVRRLNSLVPFYDFLRVLTLKRIIEVSFVRNKFITAIIFPDIVLSSYWVIGAWIFTRSGFR